MITVVLLSAFVQICQAGTIQLDVEFQWDWNITNNCGPRPQGPLYPPPPADSNRTIGESPDCDIIRDGTYIFDYKCSTPCQMAEEKTVSLYCNCFFKVGPVKQVVPCQWAYVDGDTCPEVPVENQFDWECDPRDGECAQGQYPKLDNETDTNPTNTTETTVAPVNATVTPFNPWANLPGQANPFAAFQIPGSGQPIIISPVMTQQVGDISANGGPGSSFVPNQVPSPTGFPTVLTPSTGMPQPTDGYQSQQKDLIIAETKERLRSAKSLLKATEKDLDREKNQHELVLRDATGRLDRERLEFARERKDIVDRYEAALVSKDHARQDILDQLNVLQQLFQNNLANAGRSADGTRTVEMEKTESKEKESEEEESELQGGKGIPKVLKKPNVRVGR